ncbi:hypothetical protein ACFVOR_25075 [Streptomyces sp. NPDC057837]|uniref:hypothetical protein n=1 Tax=Streptomyces sp. NPDC057837 TaxID=3346260 RepID=UPI003686DB82
MISHPFRKAVENGDPDAVAALLADDIVFLEAVLGHGDRIATAILRAVTQVFENLTYVGEIAK